MIKGLGLYFKANAMLSDSLPHTYQTPTLTKPKNVMPKNADANAKKKKRKEKEIELN